MPTAISGDTGVDQVTLAALAAKFSESGMQSLTTNGYQKLPGGLIVQWGLMPTSYNEGNGTQSTNFTIPFTTPFAITFVTRNPTSSAAIDGHFQLVSLNSSNFTFYAQSNSNNTLPGFYWIAIGI